jgi:peptide/nickel transport system substrate-binding protein
MLTPRNWKCLASSLSLLVVSSGPLFAPTRASATTRVTVAVTETIASVNPYADSVLLMYNVWCQT